MRRLLSLRISLSWTPELKLRLSNDVETNPGPRSPSKSPRKVSKEVKGPKEGKGAAKVRRSKSSVRDSGLRDGSHKILANFNQVYTFFREYL